MAGAKAAGAETENGVCILCGKGGHGVAAKPDFAIRAARKMRAVLRMEPRHTIACGRCLPLCAGKRKAFEKTMKSYQIGAAAFVLLVAAGSLVYGRLEPWLALPALLGAAIILLLPYGSYFPAFGETGKK